MANPFTIQQPNFLQGLGVIDAGLEARTSREAEQAKQGQIKQLSDRVMQGDRKAVFELAQVDPELSKGLATIDQKYQTEEKANIGNWLVGYMASPDKNTYLQEDAPFDIDDQLRAMPEEQRETLARMYGAGLMDDQQYKSVFGDQAEAQKDTTVMQNLQAAGLVKGTPEYQQAMLDYIKKPTGTTVTIGDQRLLEKATEGQLAAAGFANRVQSSNDVLTALEDKGYNPTNLSEAVAKRAPGGNYLLSDNAQLYDGAKSDFITAVLRKESGATISEEEFQREDKKYFPQPGDSPATVSAKRKRREGQFTVLNKQSKGVYDVQYAPSTTEPQAPVNWSDL